MIVHTYIGLDLHARYVHGYIWPSQAKKGRHFRFPNDPDAWSTFIRNQVDRNTWIALEATGNAFHVYDILAPHAGKVVVADTLTLKRYGDGRHTDRVDAERLAHMLALGTLRPVWVPPAPIRELRSLLQYRDRLVADRIRITNRARAVLRQQGVSVPENADPWKVVQQRREQLSQAVQLVLSSAWQQQEQLDEQIDQLTATIYRWVLDDETARRLMSLPGVGPVVAAALVAYLGDPSRFARAKQVVRYAGLDPSIHQSGERDSRGRISKNGPPLLRKLLVQAAHQIVRTDQGPLAEFYRRKVKQLGGKRVIVALARKLLVAAWRLMQTDRLAHEANLESYRRSLREVGRVANRNQRSSTTEAVQQKWEQEVSDSAPPPVPSSPLVDREVPASARQRRAIRSNALERTQTKVPA